MSTRRLVIAGTGSGVGKTTVTIGLMSALKKKGLVVQGFKCGPDYIDPTYHTAVTKRVSRNLDSWMFHEETMIDILTYGSKGADISIMEGVMGFFDGRNPKSNEGSTADVSMITESPVLLVVNCASMARSAAAIVKGFQAFAEGPNIVGVIANQVGSEGHFKLVKTAIEQECHLPVVGYLKRDLTIEIPERSLGLIPSVERGELDRFFDQLGELISETVDLDQVLQLSETTTLRTQQKESLFDEKEKNDITIAVAKDIAFSSYYPENLEILKTFGAKLSYFSPLANEPVPAEADGLYIGGGLPEEYIDAVSQSDVTKQSIKHAIHNGVPTLAEGGGFMYLTKTIETTEEKKYDMVGVIAGTVKNHPTLKAIGYREIKGREGNFLIKKEEQARGHEFHYSTFHSDEDLPYAYETKGMRGAKEEGYMSANVTAGFSQFHFASNPIIAKNIIEKCLEFAQKK